MAPRSKAAATAEKYRELREQLQRDRPTLAQLLESGEYEGPARQGDLFARLQFAAQLKQARECRKLSLAELAERSGIDKAAISRLENGTAPNPTLRTLERLASALGMWVSLRLCEEPQRPSD